MSVLIKGMDMPKHCMDCVLKNDDDDCMAQKWKEWKDWEDMRKGCPLVELPEKHGRLIDADKLKLEYPHDADWEYPVTTNERACETIDEQPTVIEAEGET